MSQQCSAAAELVVSPLETLCPGAGLHCDSLRLARGRPVPSPAAAGGIKLVPIETIQFYSLLVGLTVALGNKPAPRRGATVTGHPELLT